MFVLDTDVLSLTSPGSRLTGSPVDRWRRFVRENADQLHFSVTTLMEVRFGIERLRHRGASRQAADLNRWLLITETIHSERLIPISVAIAHRAGEMLAHAVSEGAAPSAEDALIAATSVLTNMRLVSRNRGHMNALGVECIDPLENLPL